MSQPSPHGETKRHVRGSSLMLIGRVLSLAINFVVQVLIIRYLSKEGFGAFAYGYSMATLGARILPLGVTKAVSRFLPIYHEHERLSQIKGSLFLAFATIVTTGSLLIGMVFSLRNVINGVIVTDTLSLSVLMIIISLAPLIALENLCEKLMAVFGRVKSLFFRRFLLTPLLRLVAVGALIASQGNAVFLAGAYVASTFVGVLVSVHVLRTVMREDHVLSQIRQAKSEIPAKRLYRFGIPLLSSDIVFGLRTSLVIVLLEIYHGTVGVAAYRAILPLARLNQVVFDSFRLLYVPTASRMLARGQTLEISQLFWHSTAWIAILTFPVLLLSFSLATPATIWLFGGEYASSGPVLSIIAIGLYVNSAFGFNRLTLHVFDRVKTVMKIDMTAAGAALCMNLVCVPIWGPLGGAVVSCIVLFGQNIAYHVALVRAGQLQPIPSQVARIHLKIAALAILLFAVQSTLHTAFAIGLILAALATLFVWLTSIQNLRILEFFPQVARFLPTWLTANDSQPAITSEQ